MNRLTITLPDDLYAMARSKAIASKTSISKAIGELMRQRSVPIGRQPVPAEEGEASSYFDPVLGIQVSRCAKPLTEEDIRRSMNDEDARHLEMMGVGPKEIERALTL